jgi:hypothetical protein
MFVRRLIPAIVLACAPLLLGACEKTPEPTPSESPPRPAAAPQQSAPSTAAAPRGPTDVAYDVPEGWQKDEKPNPMRKATFRITRAAGDPEDAEMSVTQFGGTVDQNVKRWFGQFEGAKEDANSRRQQKVGDLDVTIVEIHGTFNGSGMPGAPAAGPKPSWALLGAVVETQGSLTFFKMTGPDKTVTAAKPAFDKLISSLRAK